MSEAINITEGLFTLGNAIFLLKALIYYLLGWVLPGLLFCIFTPFYDLLFGDRFPSQSIPGGSERLDVGPFLRGNIGYNTAKSGGDGRDKGFPARKQNRICWLGCETGGIGDKPGHYRYLFHIRGIQSVIYDFREFIYQKLSSFFLSIVEQPCKSLHINGPLPIFIAYQKARPTGFYGAGSLNGENCSRNCESQKKTIVKSKCSEKGKDSGDPVKSTAEHDGLNAIQRNNSEQVGRSVGCNSAHGRECCAMPAVLWRWIVSSSSVQIRCVIQEFFSTVLSAIIWLGVLCFGIPFFLKKHYTFTHDFLTFFLVFSVSVLAVIALNAAGLLGGFLWARVAAKNAARRPAWTADYREDMSGYKLVPDDAMRKHGYWVTVRLPQLGVAIVYTWVLYKIFSSVLLICFLIPMLVTIPVRFQRIGKEELWTNESEENKAYWLFNLVPCWSIAWKDSLGAGWAALKPKLL